MDGLFEAQRDSVLSSRSHSEGKRQNQREKSGSSLVLIRGVKGGGSRSEPTVYTAVLCSLGVPQEPKGFPDAVFPAIFLVGNQGPRRRRDSPTQAHTRCPG